MLIEFFFGAYMSIPTDLTGQHFGKITVIKKVTLPNNRTAWEIICQCNKIKILKTSSVKRVKSCGCSQYVENRHKTHGMSKTTEYKSWAQMKERCYNKNGKDFYRYGGRGITVCSEWINSFETFYEDMGKKPSKNHSLDRIDNNKGYTKNNCRWATNSEQTYNRRKRVFTTSKYLGVSMDSRSKKWRAQISQNCKKYCIGVYDSEIEAVIAYNKKALELYGEAANLNTI